MPRNIDRILQAAGVRPLSEDERRLLASYLRDLEARQLPGDDALVRRLKELEQRLADCRELLRKHDINEIMD